MPDRFDQRSAPAAEYKHVAGEWVPAQPLLHLQRQPTHATSHVGMAGSNPDPQSGRNRDHCRARSVAVTRAVGVVASIITRTPAENSTVIATGSTGSTGTGLAEADDDGGSKGGASGTGSLACSMRMAGEKP